MFEELIIHSHSTHGKLLNMKYKFINTEDTKAFGEVSERVRVRNYVTLRIDQNKHSPKPLYKQDGHVSFLWKFVIK